MNVVIIAVCWFMWLGRAVDLKDGADHRCYGCSCADGSLLYGGAMPA